MGVVKSAEEERRDKARKKMNMTIESRTFAEVGYWLRDIKKKLKKAEIEKIVINIETTYIKFTDEKDIEL